MKSDALSLGFSPFPNDTFLFHALATGKSALPAAVRIILSELEELNQLVLTSKLDVCKVSTNILPYILEDYVVLRSGAAIGRGCGPVLVSAAQCPPEKLNGTPLATPGQLTTAHLLLSLNGTHTGPFVSMPYDEIMQAICAGRASCGLVVNEGRFLYERFGLHLILDLGSWWEAATGLPLPLGVIVMRRSLGNHMHLAMEQALRDSLAYAQSAPESSRPYIRKHARELDAGIIASYICSYVNEFSVELGPEGEAAVKTLIRQTLSLKQKTFSDTLPIFPTDA